MIFFHKSKINKVTAFENLKKVKGKNYGNYTLEIAATI